MVVVSFAHEPPERLHRHARRPGRSGSLGDPGAAGGLALADFRSGEAEGDPGRSPGLDGNASGETSRNIVHACRRTNCRRSPPAFTPNGSRCTNGASTSSSSPISMAAGDIMSPEPARSADARRMLFGSRPRRILARSLLSSPARFRRSAESRIAAVSQRFGLSRETQPRAAGLSSRPRARHRKWGREGDAGIFLVAPARRAAARGRPGIIRITSLSTRSVRCSFGQAPPLRQIGDDHVDRDGRGS